MNLLALIVMHPCNDIVTEPGVQCTVKGLVSCNAFWLTETVLLAQARGWRFNFDVLSSSRYECRRLHAQCMLTYYNVNVHATHAGAVYFSTECPSICTGWQQSS